MAWLLSAERLRDAAEVILKHEVSAELPCLQAHKIGQERSRPPSVSMTIVLDTAQWIQYFILGL